MFSVKLAFGFYLNQISPAERFQSFENMFGWHMDVLGIVCGVILLLALPTMLLLLIFLLLNRHHHQYSLSLSLLLALLSDTPKLIWAI